MVKSKENLEAILGESSTSAKVFRAGRSKRLGSYLPELQAARATRGAATEAEERVTRNENQKQDS
jgi:hypothetical protein